MMRALFLVVVLLPSAAAAQDLDVIPGADPASRTEETRLTIPLPDAATAITVQAPAPQAAPAAERRRRRPSMVGYIENASLQSQVRVRFDLGFGNDVPDRAEFFYAKCGCYRFDPPPFFDPEAPGPGPGVPTALDFTQFYVLGEFAAGTRVSLFGELPVRSIEPQGFLALGPPYDPFPGETGLGDIRFGAKVSLFSSEASDVTVLVRASAPSGDPSKGLSTNTWSLEPVLLVHRDVTDVIGLEAQIGLWHPFQGSNGVPTDSPDDFSGDVFFYGIGPSFDVVNNARLRLSPVVELVGWRVLGGFQTACTIDSCDFEAEGQNIVNLKVGARATVGNGNSFYFGYGWGLTENEWYDKIFRMEYRYGF